MLTVKNLDYDILFVSKEITKSLVDKDMTQGELAKCIGISPNSFSSKMNGKTWFSVQEAYVICDVLGLSPLIFFPHFVPISERIT